MNRPFLFLAGEWNATMPVVFEFDNWQHTTRTQSFISTPNGLTRGIDGPIVRGLIYCSRSDIGPEEENFRQIIHSKTPCWPDPNILTSMSSRHLVMERCVNHGLATGPVEVFRGRPTTKWTGHHLVLKTGEEHQGEGKSLITTEEQLNNVQELIGTLERFYTGLSTRVLFIGDTVFGVQYQNGSSWIKNSLGCDFSDWTIPPDVLAHATKVRDHFGLELTGIDYVVEPNGTFHFLEINQFPGVNVNEESVQAARQLFRKKMTLVEGLANKV